MKSGVSLQQMLTEVKRQSESKEDYLIAPNRLRMESYGKEMFLHLSDDSGTELIEPMTITGIAHRQIGTHLRIPAAYYDRMREERPDLLAYNANTWFKQESSQRMLRTLDGSARAYLSNRYRRIDNIDMLNKFWMAPIYAQVSTDLHSLLRRFIELPECAILPRRSLQGSFQRWKVNRPGIIGFIAACIGRKSWTISSTPVRCAIVTAVIIERFCVGAFFPNDVDK